MKLVALVICLFFSFLSSGTELSNKKSNLFLDELYELIFPYQTSVKTAEDSEFQIILNKIKEKRLARTALNTVNTMLINDELGGRKNKLSLGQRKELIFSIFDAYSVSLDWKIDFNGQENLSWVSFLEKILAITEEEQIQSPFDYQFLLEIADLSLRKLNKDADNKHLDDLQQRILSAINISKGRQLKCLAAHIYQPVLPIVEKPSVVWSEENLSARFYQDPHLFRNLKKDLEKSFVNKDNFSFLYSYILTDGFYQDGLFVPNPLWAHEKVILFKILFEKYVMGAKSILAYNGESITWLELIDLKVKMLANPSNRKNNFPEYKAWREIIVIVLKNLQSKKISSHSAKKLKEWEKALALSSSES